ncbi:hypothetical protein Trydic_g20322 [Trypoxylus dichotomus]
MLFQDYYNSDMAEEKAVEQDDGHFRSPSRDLRGKRISSGQRVMVYNLYEQCKQNTSKSATIKPTSKQPGLGEVTIWSILKEIECTGTIYEALDDA